MTPPMEPVLIVVDHELQLRPMREVVPRIPRLTMPSPPAGESGAVREAARLLVAAENPRINAGRLARTPNGITLLVELAGAAAGAGQRWRRSRELPVASPARRRRSRARRMSSSNLEVQGDGAPGRRGPRRRTRRRSTSRRSASSSRATCRTSSTWRTPTSTSRPTRKPRCRC